MLKIKVLSKPPKSYKLPLTSVNVIFNLLNIDIGGLKEYKVPSKPLFDELIKEFIDLSPVNKLYDLFYLH